MKPKLQILPAVRRLELAKKVNDLLPADKKKLIELLHLEIAGNLEGVFPDVSSAVYHHPLAPGFSYSSINAAVRSATHWILSSSWENQAMRLGTAFHTLALEPNLFVNKYTKDEMSTLEAMLKSLRSHRSYQIFFNQKLERKIEITIFAKCPITGLIRKCRPDLYIKDKALVDLKTTSATDINSFAKRADSLHYEGQAAFYQDTCALIGIYLPEQYHLIVSSKKPHDIIVSTYDETFMDCGRRRYLQGFQNIANFLKAA